MRRSVTAIVSVLFGSAVLVACHHGGAKAAAPTKGGTLRIGVVTPASLDPAQARSRDELLFADQAFDSLTAYDPRTLEPTPRLATRWQASTDQRQWDFTLRPGATFSNGRPITAADVKYSLERVALPATGSPGAEALHNITGYQAFATGGAPGLSGITTPSPDDVHITLDTPLSVLPSVLGSPLYGVVARESIEGLPAGKTFADLPSVYSGPFHLHDRTGSVITMDPSRASFVSRLQFVEYSDVGASYTAFREGSLDWSNVPPDQVQDAASRYGRANFRPYLGELYYAFNLKDPRFADPRLRQAISHAVDRDAIVRAVYQSTVLPLAGVVVDGVPGHQTDACGDVCRHDPNLARQLVSQMVGNGTPPTIQLDYGDDPAQAAVARAIQSNLRDAGITADLVPKAAKDYPDFAVSGQQQLFQAAWVAQYPTPDDFLGPLFLTGAGNNLSKFSSTQVDNLVRAARAQADPATRNDLYAQAERAVMQQVPVLPIAQLEIHSVVASRVRALTLDSTGAFDASVVWLAGAH